MRTLQSKLFRYCTIALCAAVVANGCRLERSELPSIANATPGEYCPGDTVRASSAADAAHAGAPVLRLSAASRMHA